MNHIFPYSEGFDSRNILVDLTCLQSQKCIMTFLLELSRYFLSIKIINFGKKHHYKDRAIHSL
jgi:hypothetical protein